MKIFRVPGFTGLLNGHLLASALLAEAPFIVRQRETRVVSQDADSLVLDGVRWGFQGNDLEKPIFKPTTVRPGRVREVFYGSQPFHPGFLLAHGMLVFLMKDLDGVVAGDGSRDIGLVMSW